MKDILETSEQIIITQSLHNNLYSHISDLTRELKNAREALKLALNKCQYDGNTRLLLREALGAYEEDTGYFNDDRLPSILADIQNSSATLKELDRFGYGALRAFTKDGSVRHAWSCNMLSYAIDTILINKKRVRKIK